MSRITSPSRAILVIAIGALLVAGSGLVTAFPAAAAPGADSKAGNVRALCAGAAKKGELNCFALARTDITGRKGVQAAAAAPAGFGPGDLRSAYALPSGTAGNGQTVAIVDAFDDPNAEADLAVYRAQFGLPGCSTANGCFSKVNQTGATRPLPAANAGWAGEIALDLQMVSAACPNCHLLLVEANSDFGVDLFAAVDTAVAMGARFVSNSYGGTESADEVDVDTHFNHPGVVFTASTGDDGYGTSYPATSPYVTAVGGTSLSRSSTARGWTEQAWTGAGSGCSSFEAKPAFQKDPDCSGRAIADVAAVADPRTGVAVYNTYQESGWVVYGGTSASAPLIAATYALAGTPVTATFPNSYPYQSTSALNDVTTGSNGSCGGSYLCTGASGYDGPTGLGTPNGVRAFTPAAAHGDIIGTVTDAATGHPVASATVSVPAGSVTTDSAGRYDLSLPAGSYDVTAAAYGYNSNTVTGVTLAAGATTTADIALTGVPKVSISGTVKDGSGHGWPLYAKISVSGVPGGPLWTDPVTGRYHVDLPAGVAYQLHVTADLPGYQPVDVQIPAGTTDVSQDVAVPVDAQSCTAPGYAHHVSGVSEAFESGSTPAGWSVVDNTDAGGWTFTDDGGRGNLTGGSGGFAIIDSDQLGNGNHEDTELRTPVLDLSAVTAPAIGFNSDYREFNSSTADLDLSIDGGQTWTTLVHQTDSVRGPSFQEIAIPQAAGQSAVQVRFHYTGTWAWWWEVDNVYVGRRSCDPVHGGLVLGQVTDRNTGAALDGAKVRDNDAPDAVATTAPTPDDPNLGDGFYWMFSPVTGRHPFTASRGGYTDTTVTVDVATDSATRADFALGAGHLAISPAALDATVQYGNQVTTTLTLRNDGSAPLSVQVNERDDGLTALRQAGSGAAVQRVAGHYDPHRLAPGTRRPAAAAPPAAPYAAPWTDLPDYPTAVMDNGVALGEGKLYSVGGTDGTTLFSSVNRYDPVTGAWTSLPNMSVGRENPQVAFIGGRLFVTGGWGPDGSPVAKTEAYDPLANRWSTVASAPLPLAAAGVGVLGGRMYVVGGCDTDVCGHPEVYAYDPKADQWRQATDYPTTVAWESCGGLGILLYCAGGVSDQAGTSTKGYAYNPVTDTWGPIADLPMVLWGSGYTAAGGTLVISGGVTGTASDTITNQGFAYDPTSNTWTPVANANHTVYRGGSACGFYRVGGSTTGNFTPTAGAEVLPGLDQCGPPADVTWLSETPASRTLAPGASVKVKVTFDASAVDVTQPGTYRARLTFQTDAPYPTIAVPVTMTVTPPGTWGKISGTVYGVKCNGTAVALPGATVQIDTWAAHYTVRTDADGGYQLWLDRRNNPLTVIVAKDGWQPQSKQVTIKAKATTTVDFRLPTTLSCP